MNAWLTLDFVSKRYGHLPSQVLESGSSIDATCAILAIQYENYVQQKAHDNAQGKKTSKEPTQEEMLAMIARTRKQRESKVNSKKEADGQSNGTQV